MDTAQWQQGIGVVRGAAADENPRPNEKKPRPEQCVNCPRCNSTNTKFCYYNNYSLSQPRYFCKTCRRYWTEGGTLRNVPVGGGSRRKHRSSSSSSPSIPPKKSAITDLTTPPKLSPDQNPKFSTYNNPNSPIYNGVPFALDSPNPNFSFMDLLKTTANFSSSAGSSSTCVIPAGNNSSVFDSNSVFSSGFPVHEIIKPTFNFDQGNGSLQSTVQDHTISSTTGFPFEEPKPVQGLQLDSNGYWNGVLPW